MLVSADSQVPKLISRWNYFCGIPMRVITIQKYFSWILGGLWSHPTCWRYINKIIIIIITNVTDGQTDGHTTYHGNTPRYATLRAVKTTGADRPSVGSLMAAIIGRGSSVFSVCCQFFDFFSGNSHVHPCKFSFGTQAFSCNLSTPSMGVGDGRGRGRGARAPLKFGKKFLRALIM